MIRLLLLSCGTNACFHIASVLKEEFGRDFYIIGCDINKRWLIPTCTYLDGFFQSPRSSDANYYPFVLEVCRKELVDFILPVFDGDQFLFSRDNQELRSLGVRSFAISRSLDFYRDKEHTNDFLESVGIPVPARFSKDTLDDGAEYFVKPIRGFGSVSARRESGAALRNLDCNDCIIEEVCSEPEYTLECFLHEQKIYSVVRERIASKAGVCTKTRIFQDKELEKYARRLSEHTELPCLFNMQFMKNSRGTYVCTDLNLRPAGGMSLSYAAGWDAVSALAHIMLGSDERAITASVDKNIPEQYVVRHYEDCVTKKVRGKIAFDLDGTLLDSRQRHEIVMDEVLKKYGIVFSADGLVEFKSDGKNNVAWLVGKGVTEEMAAKINADWVSFIENERFLMDDVLYPGVAETLRTLSKDNDLFLVTARNNAACAIRQIARLGIAQYFSDIAVVQSCAGTPSLKAAELRKHAVDCFIGDTESDLEAARMAGCTFFAIGWGFSSMDFFTRKNILVFENIRQIEDEFINNECMI